MAKKILICEDDKSLLNIMTTKITEGGFEVVSVVEGSQAVAVFLKEKPDLILLDIIMPGQSGFEILEEIRVKHSSKVPVIIISNLDQKDDVEMGASLGVTDYILKSNISLRNLMLKIQKTLTD